MKGLRLLLIVLLAAAFFIVHMFSMPGTPDVSGYEPPGLPEVAGRLREHVNALAVEIGPRHPGDMASLFDAADYIQRTLARYGYSVGQTTYGEQGFRNIQAEIPGNAQPQQIIIVGAHYDTVSNSPGADDNGSGVAAVLELAWMLRDFEPAATLRFILFPNEERPWGETGLRGSLVSAAESFARDEQIIGMLSLEMLGYYSSEPGSQAYPPYLKPFYPDEGNFLFFGSNLGSRRFLLEVIGLFRQQRLLPSYGMAVPVDLVGNVARSDNVSYWDHGFPAIMVSDTANFRNPHYHQPTDLPETLDFSTMARAVLALSGMLEALANK